MNMTICR